MTSNERKILECIWDHGGGAHIRLISDKMGLSNNYSHFLCCALKGAGHLELSGHTFCRLSEKGHKYFQNCDSTGVITVNFLPQKVLVGDSALPGILADGKEDESKGDKDEGKTDSNPSADDPVRDEISNGDDRGAAPETKENVLRNGIKYNEKGIEKSAPRIRSGLSANNMILPLFLIIIGSAFLLKNLGYIPGGAWGIIWPALLIVFGIGILLSKGRNDFFGKEYCGWRRKEIENKPR